MLVITLLSGEKHSYPTAKLTKEAVIDRLNGDIWYIETDNNIEVYRTENISHVQISKNNIKEVV